ncbi:MAG TPA: flagellar biosynthetic protein FliO [Solirubrobacterales bacterium]|nr:flagellar biosynthetic protein FliO [Solirubrobacterales bacterium]
MSLPALSILAVASSSGGESQPLDLGSTAAGAHAAGGGSVVRTIVGLAIVLAVIFGLRWVMKQYKSGREKKAAGTGLASMATLPLGQNRSLHVVRAGREILVVGSGEHGVTPVRSYSEEEAQALGLLEVEDEEPSLKLESDGPAPAGAAGKIGQRALETLRSWTVRG